MGLTYIKVRIEGTGISKDIKIADGADVSDVFEMAEIDPNGKVIRNSDGNTVALSDEACDGDVYTISTKGDLGTE